MTVDTCLVRAKVFRELGRVKEAEFWETRAVSKGYKPDVKEKAKK